jgi:hypothetical protein
MTVLKFIGSKLSSDEVWNLCIKSSCGSVEEDEGEKKKFIVFQTFLRSLRKSLIDVNDQFAARSKYLWQEDHKD